MKVLNRRKKNKGKKIVKLSMKLYENRMIKL